MTFQVLVGISCRNISMRGLLCALFVSGIFYSHLSMASEEMSKVDLLDSDLIISVVKLGGRVGCGDLRNYKNRYNIEMGTCYGSKGPEGISAYNQSVESEDFLVLKIFKGEADKFNILKIPYHGGLWDNSLEVG